MSENAHNRVGGFAGLQRGISLSVRAWRLLDAHVLGDFTGIAHPQRLRYSDHRLSPFLLCAMNVFRGFQLPESDICTFTALLRSPSRRTTTAQKTLLSTPART